MNVGEAQRLLTEFREAECRRESRSESPVGDDQILAQAKRVEECVSRLGKRRLAVLGDPVGTGKTAVALVAARRLIDDGTVDHVIISVPSRGIAQRWLERAPMVLPQARIATGKQTFAKNPVQIRSRGQGARMPNPIDRYRTLVIVDEAHRGLQAEVNVSYAAFRKVAEGCRVLFVTATPMQLAVDGLETMLQAADPTVDLRLVRDFHLALQRQQQRPAGGDTNNRAATERSARLSKLEREARRTLDRYLLSPFDRRSAGVPPPPVWTPDPVAVSEDWLAAYQIARVVPELVGFGKGDMFQRRLTSSTEAFNAGVAGTALGGDGHPELVALRDELVRRLGAGAAHPKVRATVDRVATRVEGGCPRVVVFTVFKESQTVLAEALRARLPGLHVAAPTTTKMFDQNAHKFRDPSTEPQVIVLTDRFSESVDLDRHPAFLVHHDLSWSPVRLDQRTGRLVRISSGFKALAQEDIFVPIIEVETDRRISDVAMARANLMRDVIQGRNPEKDDLRRVRQAHDRVIAGSAEVELEQLGDEDAGVSLNSALEMIGGELEERTPAVGS